MNSHSALPRLGALARRCALAAFFSVAAHAAPASDPFAEGVRTTDPLTPEQQQKTFHLPPGFEIQLFAAEPQINKPMNMAFDARGRLWVSSSVEYPFPAPLDRKGRDSIKILEDTDGDGRADKVTTFVDELNIPIGIYPYKDGVIAWSIPNIWFFRDTDGDGKADQREALFGPLGWERDTHGNQASFRRGFDGWLYATHGYNNNSTFRGRDGSALFLNSGNTYRIRLDGSRVEPHTWGQVNPFGLAYDPLGNMFSADCHSAPIYELLRGGVYPSFGKPDDGLGFAPTLMEHSHGSTAICGIFYYSDTAWPEEFRDNILIGNVMTSRINRDTLSFRGTTKIASEQPDFLRADDPWFRPVDLQYGPDGALYVSDFYNRIIGHYEVPLLHPGRDRERGRIWKIVYRGASGAKKSSDFAAMSVADLLNELGSSNMTRRMLAMNQLADAHADAAPNAIKTLLGSGGASPLQKAHGLWLLHRFGAQDEKLLADAAKDSSPLVRVHAMRILSEMPAWQTHHRVMALAGLNESDPSVKRAAADAMGQQPAFEQIQPLLIARAGVPAEDSHLLHTIRMALRNQLKPAGNLAKLDFASLSERDCRALADVAVAVTNADAGAFLLKHVQKYSENRETLNRYIRHVSRYLPAGQVDDLSVFARRAFAQDLELQLSIFQSAQEGMAQRGGAITPELRAWGAELAERLVATASGDAVQWQSLPLPGAASATPWFLQDRPSADGAGAARFVCSLPPGGEQLTGILRSKPFAIPARLSFFMAGHDGFPEVPAQKKNYMQLRDAATDTVLMTAVPPRNDMAQRYDWELSAHAGKQGYLEIVDGDTGTAYAWLAVGRFSPEVAPLPSVSPNGLSKRQQTAADLIGSLLLTPLEPFLNGLLENDAADLNAQAAASRAFITLHPDDQSAALLPVIADGAIASGLRGQARHALISRNPRRVQAAMAETFRSAPYRAQARVAQALAGSAAGADALLLSVSSGEATPRLLTDRIVKEKIAALKSARTSEQAAALSKNVPPSNEEAQKLIDQRKAAYGPDKGQIAAGAAVFTQACALCHQIEGQGAVVGPQLDGIGNRGLERLAEDILDPNRNIDRAFRTHVLKLKDGEIINGLPRREEGELLIIADAGGKEVSIPKKDVEERREVELSLMPDNFGEALTPEDFNHLMAYLLSKTGGEKGK